MQQENKKEVIESLPLIPLRDMVVFPSTLVPFIIGRESSIKALEKASSVAGTMLTTECVMIDIKEDKPAPQLDPSMMGM